MNSGTCLNTVASSVCRCVNGYTGERCEVLVDPCASQPCVRGPCSVTTNGYFCNCPAGEITEFIYNKFFFSKTHCELILLNYILNLLFY